MRTLEIIHLRFAGNGPPNLADIIRRSAGSKIGWVRIRIYRNAKLENDLAIHLDWQDVEPDEGISEVGINLAAMLREYGMVEHSAWIEYREENESVTFNENAFKVKEELK